MNERFRKKLDSIADKEAKEIEELDRELSKYLESVRPPAGEPTGTKEKSKV